MSTKFRGAGASQTKTDPLHSLGDEAFDGAAEQPPFLKFSIGMGEVLCGCSANGVQVATSTVGWLAMMILGADVLIDPRDLLSTFGWKALVALMLAVLTQSALHMNSQPMSSAWHRLRHIQHHGVKSTHAKSEVQLFLGVRAGLGYVALLLDMISDASFIHTILGALSNPLVELLIIAVWMIMLSGGSTVLLYDGATRVWGAMEDARDYRSYHKAQEGD